MTRPDIIKQIADAHYQLADLYNQLAADSSDSVRSDAGQGSVPPASPAPAFEESPFTPDEFATSEDQGSEAVCPAHHKPFIDGKFGPYCPNPGMDPAWTNKRGYCTVNPKNVATYLRVKAAA